MLPGAQTRLCGGPASMPRWRRALPLFPQPSPPLFDLDHASRAPGAAAMSRDAKKAEQRLKALLKEPANKRCANCDSLVRCGAAQAVNPGLRQLPAAPTCSLVARPLPRPRRRAPSMWSATTTSSSAPCAAACSEWGRAPHPPPAAAAGAAAPRVSRESTPARPAPPARCSRQFGHRVKGVSMSTFKPEEVAALAESGNAVGGRTAGSWVLPPPAVVPPAACSRPREPRAACTQRLALRGRTCQRLACPAAANHPSLPCPPVPCCLSLVCRSALPHTTCTSGPLQRCPSLWTATCTASTPGSAPCTRCVASDLLHSLSCAVVHGVVRR